MQHGAGWVGSSPASGGSERSGWSAPTAWERLARGRLGTLLRSTAHALLAPRDTLERRSVARAILPGLRLGRRVDPRTGYVRFEVGELPGAAEIVARCRARRRALEPLLPAIQSARTGKFALTFDLLSDSVLARESEWLEFALQEEVFGPAVEYLRTVPFLARIGLGLSVHLEGLARPSYNQRLHLDRDDARHLKLFVNAQEVEEADGPLCFFPADVTERIAGALAREGARPVLGMTFADADILRHADPAELVRATGPAGSGVYFDGSRCLHFGSRVQPGRERLQLALVFLRAIRVHETPTNQFARSELATDRTRRLLLRSPRPRPAGYYFPDPGEDPSPAARGAGARQPTPPSS